MVLNRKNRNIYRSQVNTDFHRLKEDAAWDLKIEDSEELPVSAIRGHVWGERCHLSRTFLWGSGKGVLVARG
jgi:hypothetical protein